VKTVRFGFHRQGAEYVVRFEAGTFGDLYAHRRKDFLHQGYLRIQLLRFFGLGHAVALVFAVHFIPKGRVVRVKRHNDMARLFFVHKSKKHI
jgi:hypothetical protein